jgi:CBS domain-containing membrane protein
MESLGPFPDDWRRIHANVETHFSGNAPLQLGIVMQNERVRHIMTETVLSIGVHESVTKALRLFAHYPVHHLPVVDGLELKGMLSSADMLKLEHFIPKAGAPGSVALLTERFRIDSMMRQPVITAKLDDTIADAASRMTTHAIHALPVVDENNHLIGMVTTTDIMHALLHGIGLKPDLEQHAANRKPTELEVRRAIEAARSSTLNRTDTNGVAATMLFLHERNALLEELRQNVARYLHGGQDERLHTRLLKDMDRLDQQTELSIRL